MPNLDVSELNIVLGVLGAFILLFGIISIKIKNAWFLGEARGCPLSSLRAAAASARSEGSPPLVLTWSLCSQCPPFSSASCSVR